LQYCIAAIEHPGRDTPLEKLALGGHGRGSALSVFGNQEAHRFAQRREVVFVQRRAGPAVGLAQELVAKYFAGTASNVEGRAFDLGTGIAVSIRTVVEKLANLIKSPIELAFGALPERPFERVRTANTSHSYETLGWKSEVLRRISIHGTAGKRRMLSLITRSSSGSRSSCATVGASP
jgi:hypothetical protein